MTIQEMQRLHSAKPFEPFTIQVADGNEYEVRHPEHIAIGGKGRLVSVWMPDESFVTLDLLLVTGIRKNAADIAQTQAS
ncbi:MAG: hypothetical protein AAF743_04510 [Planctomycetota bacterium]